MLGCRRMKQQHERGASEQASLPGRTNAAPAERCHHPGRGSMKMAELMATATLPGECSGYAHKCDARGLVVLSLTVCSCAGLCWYFYVRSSGLPVSHTVFEARVLTRLLTHAAVAVCCGHVWIIVLFKSSGQGALPIGSVDVATISPRSISRVCQANVCMHCLD